MPGGHLTKKQRAVFIGLVVLIMAGLVGFIAYDFWTVNQKTAAILKAPGTISKDSTDTSEKAAEGSEMTPITKDDLSTYQVAATEPRIITINALHIAARIRPMSLNSDNSIQAPKNINDAGWYTGSAKPGEAGVMFIDGHASGATRLGLFGSLDSLKTDDTVTVEKGDGTKLTYVVVRVSIVPLDSIDMSTVLTPIPGATQGLVLMSCTGAWVESSATLNQRVIVQAKQV